MLIDSAPRGATPTIISLETRPQSYKISVVKEGFQTETVEFTPGKDGKELTLKLAPLIAKNTFSITSAPSGATVSLNGRILGTTPCEVPLTFQRTDKLVPWQPLSLQLALTDHQTETLVLRENSPPPEPVGLSRLKIKRSFQIATRASEDGQPILGKASLSLEGKPLEASAPTELPLVFQRNDKSQPWPKFAVRAEIPNLRLPTEASLLFDSPEAVTLDLAPVTEVNVARPAPVVAAEPGSGAVLRVQNEERLGTINTLEPNTKLALTQITQFKRNSPKAETLHSFALLPKGDAAVISIITRSDRTFSARLARVPTRGPANTTILTKEDEGFLDISPVLSREEQGTLTLVFQSNRVSRTRTDIFRLNLDETNYAAKGGVTRVTNDGRFNFSPTLVDTTVPIFYLSTESGFEKAEPQLFKLDLGSREITQLSLSVLEIAQRELSSIFFVRRESDSKKLQLYRAKPDGSDEARLLTDRDLNAADCTHPAPAYKTGGRVLFVSDAGVDKLSRHHRDIYIVNSDGSDLQRLTTNASDDILPAWSPAEGEPDVFYFISNRGGAYNLWRAEIPGAK